MEINLKYKIIGIIAFFVVWLILLTGVIKVSALIWMVLIIIIFLFYFAISRKYYRRKGSLEGVVDNMDDYIKRKAKETNRRELRKREQKEKTQDIDD